MSLARNVLVQTTFTLGSRVLGFARDLALNARFGGQGPLMDAWTKALWLPNLFRRLFAEGAFAQAFVPVFAKTLQTEGQAAAEKAASQALAYIMMVVAAFSIVLEIVMPWLMPVILYTYVGDPEVMAIAVVMTQLTTPYLACMTLASLLSGVLNTKERFALSAGAPILLNVTTLVPLLVIPDRTQAAYFASAAVTIAGLLQGAMLWWGVKRLGFSINLDVPRLTDTVKRVLALAIPGAIAGGAVQLNSAVSNVLTGTDRGASSVLYNSERLYQLPIGLIGVAVGMALVPRLSRHFADTDHASADRAMDDGIALAMAFTLPAALALLIMPYFIIDGIVTRGEFSSDDARRTADVLRQFSWGVPAFVLAKVFTPPFFARQRTRQPAQFAMISVFINLALGATLWFALPYFFKIDGAIGIAIATSVGGWVNVIQLATTLAGEKVYRISTQAWGRLARLGLACAVMGVFIGVCALNYPLLSKLMLRKEIATIVVASAGFGVFLACAVFFRAVTLAEIKGSLRREKAARASPCRPAARADKGPPMTEHIPAPYTGPRRVFSGVQPSGSLHLGNYLGALVKFVAMQATHDCIFCVVDLHAITVPQDPKLLAAQTREIAAAYLASGIDPKRSIVFAQSAVHAHVELAWIFNCVARMGWLERMTQFKDKSGKDRERASVGLFDYPVLQAADILAYKATHVPTGEDQKQHLELSRDIADRFNREFNAPGFFPLPEPLTTGPGARIMSLRDGSKKMSKSDPSDQTRINLLDTADDIAKKIKRATTDPHPLPASMKELEGRNEAANLVGIYAVLAGMSEQGVLDEFGGKGFGVFKPALADLAVSRLGPVAETMRRLMNDPAEVDAVLKNGASRAREIAEPVMEDVRRIVGFWGA